MVPRAAAKHPTRSSRLARGASSMFFPVAGTELEELP
jgi:hypothetical protein